MKKYALILAAMAMLVSFSCFGKDKTETVIKSKTPKISVQLWSVREQLKRDFNGTVKQLAGMGFDGVELYRELGPYKDDAKGLKAFLDGLGLEVSASHVSFSSFDEKNFDKTVAFYKTLETDTLIIGWDERAWDASKVDGFIAELNALYKKLKSEGFKFGFHNHDKEFNQYKGATFWDHIARSTPDDFVLQLDVGWVTAMEKDPVVYITRYPGRTLTTHIKATRSTSSSKGKETKSPILGEDATDWPSVLKAGIAVGGTKWFVVEQEEYPDGLSELEAVQLSKNGLDKIIANMRVIVGG